MTEYTVGGNGYVTHGYVILFDVVMLEVASADFHICTKGIYGEKCLTKANLTATDLTTTIALEGKWCPSIKLF